MKYEIEWGWDNQYKSEISEVKFRIEQQVPVKYQPYLLKKMQKIDRRYGDLKISNSPANSNRFIIEFKNPYYRVFLRLKNENGNLIRKDLLRNGISLTNIDQKNTSTYKDIIVLNRRQNSKLQYLNIDYKKNKLFSRWLGFKINTRYDYISSDTSSGLLINNGWDAFHYYGLSIQGFLNLKLSKPKPLLTASRFRIGLTGSILSYNEIQGYNDKIFYTIAPVFAFEAAKTKKGHTGVLECHFHQNLTIAWEKKSSPIHICLFSIPMNSSYI